MGGWACRFRRDVRRLHVPAWHQASGVLTMTTHAPAAFKPCPFCEGADIRCDRHHESRSPTGFVWSMCCYNCGATFPNRYKRELLVEAWNRRPQGRDNGEGASPCDK